MPQDLKAEIDEEAEHMNISKRDMVSVAWRKYTESKKQKSCIATRSSEEANTNFAFKMICDALHLSNKQIVEIIKAGSEEGLNENVTKSQVEKYKSSLKRIQNATANNQRVRLPVYKEMPQAVFEAFAQGLTIYDFGE